LFLRFVIKKKDEESDDGGRRNAHDERHDRGRTNRSSYPDSNRTLGREKYSGNNNRGHYTKNDKEDDRNFSSRGQDHCANLRNENDDRFRHDRNRGDRYNETQRREKPRYRDDGENGGRYRDRRERSDSGYSSDEYGGSRRDSRRNERSRREGNRNSFDRSDHRRRHSRDFASDDQIDDGEDAPNKKRVAKEPKEWPPSFQKDGSAFTFDVRSAMFYEPLSDFFYDPKSKLYYGNKKCAYFRYDEKEKPPFVEVQKMTSEQVEEQQRGESGGIEQEIVAVNNPASVAPPKPKIAIKFKTKKVKSSVSTVAAREGANQQLATNTVSKAKQQQIANIGKWNEKQAELKQGVPNAIPNAPLDASKGEGGRQPSAKPKIRTTAKGEPICMLCKRKFPDLAKLQLHEKGSELHKKNLLALKEKRKKLATAAAGTKRKLDQATCSAVDPSPNQATDTTPVYTDRAEKRRQLHGTDLCAPVQGPNSLLHLSTNLATPPEGSNGDQAPNGPGTDLLEDETNLGHQMLQKMGYKAKQQEQSTGDNKPATTNEHLRKEWDRIEAMAQKSDPRNRY
jgi:RNA-binding protein 5/10